MTRTPLRHVATDAYSAYGANLEAGLEGDIADAGATEEGERGRSRGRSGSVEEGYEDERGGWREGSHGHGRRPRRDNPSATLYVRVGVSLLSAHGEAMQRRAPSAQALHAGSLSSSHSGMLFVGVTASAPRHAAGAAG